MIPHDGRVRLIEGPFTLTKIKDMIGGKPILHEVPSGDLLLHTGDGESPFNQNATDFTGRKPTRIHGDAMLCDPSELL